MKHIQLIILLLFIINYKTYSQNYFNDSSMVYVKKGTYYNEENAKVIISAFYISKYEITNNEYCKFLNSVKLQKDTVRKYINLKSETCKIYLDNETFKVEKDFKNYPVSFVSWFGANAFCKFYNLRLPSKNEWEFAAFTSNKFSLRKFFKKYFIFSGSNNANEVAWFKNNSNKKTHKVGLKMPNKLYIYDMSGNLDEWCNDWYLTNNKKGVYKVIKGGSWYNSEKMLQVKNTRATNPKSTKATIGFRVVKDVETFCKIKN